MGSRAEPIIAFGFPLGDEEGESWKAPADFAALVEASDNMTDKDWPVELVPHGYHDYRYWFLSIRGTSSNGGDWGSTVRVPDAAPTRQKIEAAKAWCASHKLPWQTPHWVALAAYR